MIRFKQSGDFRNIERFLKKARSRAFYKKLDEYGQLGVEALREATPKRTGLTSESWSYKVDNKSDSIELSWSNSNWNKSEQIAVIIQYGHGTGRGVYVKGRDYINPAMDNVFQQIADDIWKEVVNA